MGTLVEKDQILAQLVNLDVRKQIVESLTRKHDQQRLQLQNLKWRLAEDPNVGRRFRRRKSCSPT